MKNKNPFSRETYYEWTREEIDEHGDIQDSDHAPTLKELRGRYSNGTFGLVRNVGSEANGVEERDWAYLDKNGKLPEFFQNASGNNTYKVPQKFHKETK